MTGCEALVGAALFACLARNPECLPEHLRPLEGDLRGIAEQESGLRPYAVRDEARREGRFFSTHAEAVAFAVERDALGHTAGLGWFQITHRANWDRHFGGASTAQERAAQIARALDPCANMRAGAVHYWGNIRSAAFQMYNSGRINGAPAYAASVMRRIENAATSVPAPPVSAPALPARSVPPTAPTKPWAITPHTADTAIYTREMPHALRID